MPEECHRQEKHERTQRLQFRSRNCYKKYYFQNRCKTMLKCWERNIFKLYNIKYPLRNIPKNHKFGNNITFKRENVISIL